MNFTPSSVILPRAFAASTLVALGLPLKYSNTSFWVVSKFFWVAISLFWVVPISSNCPFWVADSLFWVVESLFWIVLLSFKASFWIVSLSFKAPFWIVERSLGVPTEKAKDPPWFAVQMGSVADSVAAKIRIIFDNTNFSARKNTTRQKCYLYKRQHNSPNAQNLGNENVH